MADGDKNPKLDFKNVKLGKEYGIWLKLDCAKAVKTGENNFGTWHMWFGITDGTVPVIDADKKVIKGYKGKVIFFPSKGLNRDLEKAANGNVEVEVRIAKTAREGQRGLLTVFEVEKLSEGKPSTFSPTISLTEIEQSFINEINDLINTGHKVSKSLVLKAARDPNYQISEERVEELYTLIKR